METFAQHYGAMCAAILNRMPGADMELIDQAVAHPATQPQDIIKQCYLSLPVCIIMSLTKTDPAICKIASALIYQNIVNICLCI